MGTPLDNFEFETVKQLRKSLLIASTVGIAISYLIYYSTGTITLFGFTFQPEQATIIPKLVGCITIYFLISFLIVCRNDELPKIYDRKIAFYHAWAFGPDIVPKTEDYEKTEEEIENKVNEKMNFSFRLNEWLMKTKDIFFPIILGFYSCIVCFTGWGII